MVNYIHKTAVFKSLICNFIVYDLLELHKTYTVI